MSSLPDGNLHGINLSPPEEHKISIIIPCYNESRTIRLVLDSVYAQDYPRESLEVIIADGISEDDTRDQIKAFAREHPDLDVVILDNTRRTIPAALNTAIQQASGEFIVRLDAHSIPAPDYVSRCVQLLQTTKAANVGGVWRIRPEVDTWIAKSIAVAAGHPLGAGDARYRIHGQPGPVDTVPFGAFPRAWLDRIGPFNQDLLTNEDYEYNVRIRSAGGKILFDPSIKATYYSRQNFPDLARQYWRYGFWKARMLQTFPESIRWRQALPPLFVLVSVLLFLTGFLLRSAWLVLGVQWAIYGVITLAAGFLASLRSKTAEFILGFPIAIFTMHLFWGTGFLWSLISSALDIRDG